MRFIDNNIKLTINNLIFKAYLDDSDTTFETKDQTLPLAPVSFTNDSISTRLNQKSKFTFNVYSETRLECITNYKNLLQLINSFKPMYDIIEDQYVPRRENLTGLVSLKFSGLPIKDSIKLHLNNFSYEINKELGYIQIPKEDLSDNSILSEDFKFYKQGNMKLIPLAYKISLEGKVLLTFEETIRKMSGERIGTSGVTIQDYLSKAGGDVDYQQRIRTLYQALTDRPLEAIRNPANLQEAILKTKYLKDQGIIDSNTGDYNPYDESKKAPRTPQEKENFEKTVLQLKENIDKL